MPIYEYQCQACDHHFEKLQKISDEPLSDCPDCSKPELKKLVSAAAFRLKGGGWYETDFKTGNKKNVEGGSDYSSKKSTPTSTEKSSSKKSIAAKTASKTAASSN